MRRPAEPERGVAAVELAFVLPLLLIFSMGIIDIGRVLYTLIAVHEAAQEGAVYGSFRPQDSEAVRQRVVGSVDYPTLTTADVTVTCPDGAAGGKIAVTVEHDLDLITPIIGQWFGGSITLERSEFGEVYSTEPCDESA